MEALQYLLGLFSDIFFSVDICIAVSHHILLRKRIILAIASLWLNVKGSCVDTLYRVSIFF